MAHPALAGARRAMLATRDAHGLYAQFGFQAPPDDGMLMEIVRPDMYRDGADIGLKLARRILRRMNFPVSCDLPRARRRRCC